MGTLNPALRLRPEPQEGFRPSGFDRGEGAPYRVLSLFAGIGGFDLGLERTGGFKTVAFCEIDPFCQKVLAKHWPGVPIYNDVRTLTAEQVGPVDVICGGFPCQDLSFAGKGAGLAGERSGLWSEYARLVGELRPAFVIVENVAALLSRGLGTVLGDLAALGYDAEWHCIPASAVGAWQYRDRTWILAYAASERSTETRCDSERSEKRACSRLPVLADTESGAARSAQSGNGHGAVEGERPIILPSLRGCDSLVGVSDWHSEPGICRVADGVSENVDRVAALGNAIVPQIAELIGRAILSCDSGSGSESEARRAEGEAPQSGGAQTPHRPDSTVALPILHTMKDLRHV